MAAPQEQPAKTNLGHNEVQISNTWVEFIKERAAENKYLGGNPCTMKE